MILDGSSKQEISEGFKRNGLNAQSVELDAISCTLVLLRLESRTWIGCSWILPLVDQLLTAFGMISPNQDSIVSARTLCERCDLPADLDLLLDHLRLVDGINGVPLCLTRSGYVPLTLLAPNGGKGLKLRGADGKWINGLLQLRDDELVVKIK